MYADMQANAPVFIQKGDRRDKLEQQPIGMKCVATGAMLTLWRGLCLFTFQCSVPLSFLNDPVCLCACTCQMRKRWFL